MARKRYSSRTRRSYSRPRRRRSYSGRTRRTGVSRRRAAPRTVRIVVETAAPSPIAASGLLTKKAGPAPKKAVL